MRIEEVDYDMLLKIRQEVMYPEKDISFVRLDNDDQGIHIGAYEETELVSVVSIFMLNGDVQFRKLATKVNEQNKGYASSLIKWLLAYTNEMKISRVWANSRVNILPFYEQFGFKKTSETFTKDGHDYVIIEHITEYPI